MSEKIKVTYDGIEIEYREQENDWHFELRGRERSAETLAKAKEAIDKPVKEKSTFVRVKGFLQSPYGDIAFAPCEITSIAESNRWSSTQYVWANIKGERKKIAANTIVLDTPENAELMGQWLALDRQEDEAAAKKRVLFSKMETYKAKEEQPA